MRNIILLLLLALAIYGAFELYTSSREPKQPELQTTDSSTVKIGDASYRVDIADDDNERFRGLSGRPSMAQDRGLLFLFDIKDTYAFWMKDMHIPIDIVWIDENIIADIDENVPIPIGNYYPKYQPKTPVNKVLEINAGEVKRNDFKIGQDVIITLIKPQRNP